MADGNLRCLGSPLFLKKHYGVGYQLTIEKDRAFQETAQTQKTVEEGGEKLAAPEHLDDALASIVTKNVTEAKLLTNVGSEMSFQLPISAAPDFAPMFEGLDKQVEKGAISSYGVGYVRI
jgi:ATP-binding cassette, subfamily A (ABC1), member 3